MAFTTPTLVHTFLNGDSTPASGKVTAQLTKRMTNSGTTIYPSEVTGTLNASGQLSLPLVANTDNGTVPNDVQWTITIRLQGLPTETFVITVPSGTGNVDLGTLLPGNEQVS